MSTNPTQPSQPPKPSAYTQQNNPISQNPAESNIAHSEQRTHAHTYGDAPATIIRGACSTPSNPSTLLARDAKRAASQNALANEPDVDTEYGIEQQPGEGDIAAAVEGASRGRRVQAGAHAGPVGSANGPGVTGVSGGGVESDLKDLGRKEEEHWRVLGDKVGRSPGGEVGDEVLAENERVREKKLRQDRELHPGDVVREATGDPVAR